MTSRTHSGTTGLRLTLMVLLSVVAAVAGAAAAPAPPAPVMTPATARPEEPLEQLDEIVVRGESVIKAINDAEDNFYALFNQVNKDDDYDTHCVYLNIDPDNANSTIKSRVCLPGFVADAMADYAVFRACDGESDPQKKTTCFQPPPPQLVLMERSNRWAVEMMKVINSDPRLKEQAGHLDDLYRELRTVQRKYTQIKSEDLPEKTNRRELGPRMH
jgi:hypothetical protein